MKQLGPLKGDFRQSGALKLVVSAVFVAASAAYVYWRNQVRMAPSQITDQIAEAAPVATPAPTASAQPETVRPEPRATAPDAARDPVAPKPEAPSEAPPPAQSAPVSPAEPIDADPAPLASTHPTIVPGPKRFHLSDGDYVGAPAESEWGPVQVKAIIRDGYIVDVQFLKIPDHRERSAQISAWAAPKLISEAIKEQYYDVDIVSSATFTTIAFQESLWSALSQAQK